MSIKTFINEVMIVYDWIAHMVKWKIWECLDLGLPLLFALTLEKWHGIAVSMLACVVQPCSPLLVLGAQHICF